MLSLLPENTLHILDDYSSRAMWLEPWRELTRTIAFNAEHVFVSRRLVRTLKGRGRLAVYFPEAVEPDLRSFRLYRAVTRIAMQADARIVPIYIGGARALPFSLTPSSRASSGLASSASPMKVSSSRFDSASRRIACCNCGVITSDCDCRRSSRGPSAIGQFREGGRITA